MNSAIAKQRLKRALALAEPCQLCPQRCGANRIQGQIGLCGAGPEAALFLEYVHWGEDADIVPAQTLYLTGCNLACRFCQTAEEQRFLPSVRLTAELFSRILERGWRAGAEYVNILGGEPTVNLPALLKLFAEAGDFPGLVWNTNLYGSAEAFLLLDGLVDVFMADIKFGGPRCGHELAGAQDAGEVARARALEIYGRSPEALIVRHLVMPGHYECCTRPVLEWIARRLPGVRVSLKTVYLPPKSLEPGCPENRFLSPEEVSRAGELAQTLGLRLTRDADWPPSPPPRTSAVNSGGDPVLVEVAISPEGRVYMRHIVREAAGVLRTVAGPAEKE
jgi:putative pyruvate formate lyase activating enzyme